MKIRICKKITGCLFFSVCWLGLLGQNNHTLSPYSRYGYGQLAEKGSAMQRAMGGIGIGLRNGKTINPLNAASMSAIDSLTFMLDLGVKGQIAWMEDTQTDSKMKYQSAGIEYIAMQVPLAKRLGWGVGLKPVSYVGYCYGDTGNDTVKIYSGKGGLNQVYTRLAYDFGGHLSLGVGVGYLYGDIVHKQTFRLGDSPRNEWSDSLRSCGMTWEGGLQYRCSFGKQEEIVVGMVYVPKIKFNGKKSNREIDYNSKDTTTSSENVICELPETYALGLSCHKFNKWTIGIDWEYQRWRETLFYSPKDSLSNRMKICIGAEYIRKLRYRAGGYYGNSYVRVNGRGYDEYGLSIGLGIPAVDKRSFVNLAVEYIYVGGKEAVLNEQYCRLAFSYTFNEQWFYRRKLQ